MTQSAELSSPDAPAFSFSPPTSPASAPNIFTVGAGPYRFLPRPPSPPHAISSDSLAVPVSFVLPMVPPPTPPLTSVSPANPSMAISLSPPSTPTSLTPSSSTQLNSTASSPSPFLTPSPASFASNTSAKQSPRLAQVVEGTPGDAKMEKAATKKLDSPINVEKIPEPNPQPQRNSKEKPQEKPAEKQIDKSPSKPDKSQQEKPQEKQPHGKLMDKLPEKLQEKPQEKPQEKSPEKPHVAFQDKSPTRISAEKPSAAEKTAEKSTTLEKTTEQQTLEKLLEKPWPKPPPMPPYRLSRRISALRKFDRDRSSKKNSKPPIDIFEGEHEPEAQTNSFRVRMANLRNMFERPDDTPKLPVSNSKLFGKSKE